MPTGAVRLPAIGVLSLRDLRKPASAQIGQFPRGRALKPGQTPPVGAGTAIADLARA